MGSRRFFAWVAALVTVGIGATAITALAASPVPFDGVYVNADGGNVAYFQIVDIAGRLTGEYTVVVRDSNSDAGLDQSRFSVTGTGDATRALLGLSYDTPGFQAPLGYRWIARANANGFTLEMSLGSGQIAEVRFRRATIGEVNGLIAEVTTVADNGRRVRAAHLELAAAEARLRADLAARFDDVRAIATAQDAFSAAQARMQSAQLAVSDLQREARRRRDEAGSGPLVDDRALRTDLLDQANYATFAADAARADVGAANDQLALAQGTLGSAKQVLGDRDTRIARLKSVIARDTGMIASATAPQPSVQRGTLRTRDHGGALGHSSSDVSPLFGSV
jgi:hypothetical protein